MTQSREKKGDGTEVMLGYVILKGDKVGTAVGNFWGVLA